MTCMFYVSRYPSRRPARQLGSVNVSLERHDKKGFLLLLLLFYFCDFIFHRFCHIAVNGYEDRSKTSVIGVIIRLIETRDCCIIHCDINE